MQKQSKKSKFIMIVALLVILLLAIVIYSSISIQNIADVKAEKNIGDTVRVRGEVKSVIKIGSLSGYTLEDESGKIAVSSENLPKEGQIITVKGTLIRDTLFGYYIKAD